MEDSLGIYIHIPFCIQRCSYCDFATYAKDQIQANRNYVDTLILEGKKRRHIFGPRPLKTIYFGGGTPSLLPPDEIHRIIQSFKDLGHSFCDDIEITLEVNPATLDENKCAAMKDAGVNRVSLGCQTFNDEHLQMVGREHNSQQTLESIELIKKHFQNYSLDLLFSLPKQGLKLLSRDLEILTAISPPHISAYCLTLVDKHPLNRNRPSDQEQVKMFELIEDAFTGIGLKRYEISNFAKPGFESVHNSLYWMDKDYWGLGLSAHSYKSSPGWGTRFWNPSSYDTYMKRVDELVPADSVEKSFAVNEREELQAHESLTDFCHTQFRLDRGLAAGSLRHKFGEAILGKVGERLRPMIDNGLICSTQVGWQLTKSGVLVSNQVFANLLFDSEDLSFGSTAG